MYTRATSKMMLSRGQETGREEAGMMLERGLPLT